MVKFKQSMAHLIDKDALVAEIKKRFDKYSSSILKHYDACVEAKAQELGKILTILDTLEVKEMDLEKELGNWRHEHFHGRRDKEASGEYLERVSQLDLAKHFYELGINAQKGK